MRPPLNDREYWYALVELGRDDRDHYQMACKKFKSEHTRAITYFQGKW